MKEDEKKTIPWEAVDPKPPVIHSGHMENRVVRWGTGLHPEAGSGILWAERA